MTSVLLTHSLAALSTFIQNPYCLAVDTGRKDRSRAPQYWYVPCKLDTASGARAYIPQLDDKQTAALQ